MRTILCGIGLLAMTIFPAIFQGRVLHRWGRPQQLEIANRRVEHFPAQFGGWEAAEDDELIDDRTADSYDVTASLSRSYYHPEFGTRMSILLMAGPPAELLVHSPEVCYQMRGDRLIGKREFVSVGENGDNFAVCQYVSKGTITQRRFTVSYALNAGETGWRVPSSRRIEMGGAPSIVTVQILVDDPPAGDTLQFVREHVLSEFLEAWSQSGPIQQAVVD